MIEIQPVKNPYFIVKPKKIIRDKDNSGNKNKQQADVDHSKEKENPPAQHIDEIV